MTSSLRESEENLSITLHSIGDAVIATDALGRVTRMNPVAERLTGWTLAQARDRPLAEVFCIINANTRAPVADPVQAVMLRGQVVDLANDTLLLARDQTECQIADSAAPIRNAAGEVVGVVLVFSDVTEKYQTEQALRESESRFREIFNSVSDAIFIHDAQTGRILDVNRSMCEMYGHTHAQALDCGPADLSFDKPPYSTAEAMETMQMARTKGPQSFDWLARARDGRPLWTSVSLKFAHIGSQERILAVVRDVSQRKEAEAKLQLAASVFDHAREGIIITDASGTIIDINEAFVRITGYGRDEALGQNPRMLKSDRQDQTFYEAMWRDLIDQGHWSGEIWNRHKDDEVYAELLTISSVRDASGAVQQYVGLFSDISAMKEHQIQLEHIAHFDALTNLPNRVLLADLLQQAMAQAQRRRQQLAVVYLDLDGFKAINDQHGHDAGDQVLITLAQRMKHALREGDSLARLGGDEFVAVLIDLEDLAASRPLLGRLLEACSQSVRVGDLNLQVSASLGVTVFPQQQDIDADQLLRQADQAMYQAKLSGKNRFHFFDAEQDSSIRGRHESVERIRLALDNQEFVLYFQPKVNMRSGQIIGAEALIRWQHPEKGLLTPALFLPVIEGHPLAVSIGEWVIDKALTQMELWQAAGLDMKVSVNIGARQLQQGDFVDRLKFILAKHPQVNPASLELEVLETSALEDIAQVSDVIEACAHIGVKFALDDFGTGYSSLAYLKRLRVAMLKIDQSFVRDMLEDPDDLAILQGIIGLAESFKRQVIAEGVETVAHGSLLMQLGCELAQGYGIARPMPPDQLPGWAASWQPDAAWGALPWLGGLETEW
jgi:diguanylate cyclase (GGDEF)-like protein/PAS domain S-box-containing protein